MSVAPKRVYNFNPGTAALPLEVLQEAQAEMLDFKGTGMSVMEISHRSKEFEGVIHTAEADLRELLLTNLHCLVFRMIALPFLVKFYYVLMGVLLYLRIARVPAYICAVRGWQ